MQQGQSPIRPALLTVDDDPQVLRAIERDLRRHFGRDYRVVGADSGDAALDALDELRRRDEPKQSFRSLLPLIRLVNRRFHSRSIGAKKDCRSGFTWLLRTDARTCLFVSPHSLSKPDRGRIDGRRCTHERNRAAA